MSDFVHEIRFYPAFDDVVNGCDHPKKGDHGRGSVTLVMSSQLDNVAVVLTVHTGWHLPETHEKGRTIAGGPIDWDRWATTRLTSVVDIHSPVPLFEDHSSVEGCAFTGGDCYPDTAYTAADDFVDALFRKGDDALWPLLDLFVSELTTSTVHHPPDVLPYMGIGEALLLGASLGLILLLIGSMPVMAFRRRS